MTARQQLPSLRRTSILRTWSLVLFLVLSSGGVFTTCCGKVAAIVQVPENEEVVGDRLTPTGRVLKPAGELLTFEGRPVDLRLSSDARWLFTKSNKSLIVIDPQTWKIVQSIGSEEGASLWGLAVSKANRVFFTNARSEILVFAPNPEPTASRKRKTACYRAAMARNSGNGPH